MILNHRLAIRAKVIDRPWICLYNRWIKYRLEMLDWPYRNLLMYLRNINAQTINKLMFGMKMSVVQLVMVVCQILLTDGFSNFWLWWQIW